jgi:hypothetical protein
MLDIKLHPKQILALTTPANEVLYGGAVGGGKALHVDTPIFTLDGWKTMGALQVGDKVLDSSGVPCNVIAKSEIDYTSPTYEVVFDKNRPILCDGRHMWPTVRGILTTEELKKGDSIEAPTEFVFSEADLPIDPYILGTFLAGRGMIDMKLREGMTLSNRCASSGIVLKTYHDGKYYWKESWYSLLDQLGLKDIGIYEKFVPHIYKIASVEQRKALLQGMMDVAGTVYTDSGSYNRSIGQVEIYTPNERLNNDVAYLLMSIGENPRKYKRKYPPTYTDTLTKSCAYRVRCYCKQNIFRSYDKKLKLEKSLKKRKIVEKDKRIIVVTRINQIEPQPKQCIQVDSPTHCYLAGEWFIPTHNSFLMRTAAITWAMQCPGIQIYLFRLTRKELIDNHMVGPGGFNELLGEAINTKFAKINNSDHVITFRNGSNNSFLNGSMIHLCHCQHEDDKYLYQGAEMAVLMIDEATHFSKTKYEYLRTRVRLAKTWKPPREFTQVWGEKFFPRILLGSNPGGVSFSFFRREFVKLVEPFTIVKMPNEKGGMLRQYIPAKLEDNPSIDKEEYEGKVMGVGNAGMAKMLLEGDWDAIAGGMFDDVWDDSVHMIEPFEIPESWYIDRSFDWGYTDPFSVGWWAQSDGTEVTLNDGSKVTFPKNTLFRIAEWYGWTGEENVGAGLTAYEIGHGIKKREKENPVFKNARKVYPGPADTQIWNTNIKQDSMYRSLVQEMNSGYYNSSHYTMFDIFTKADKTYGSRIRGWDVLRTHLKNSLKFPKVDRECIFFFKTCPNVSRIIPITVRHESKIEDIADGQEDHILDEIRYRVQHTIQRMRKINTRVG